MSDDILDKCGIVKHHPAKVLAIYPARRRERI